jgi:sugar lactone lactonase YvrE
MRVSSALTHGRRLPVFFITCREETMKATWVIATVCGLVLGSGGSSARADDPPFPQKATFTTQAITPLAIEGLTGDARGDLYTTGRATPPALCPVWKISGASLTTVGFLPNPSASPCNPSGITFDRAGTLFIADAASGGVVWRLTPDEGAPPTATSFATGVPGTNGLAFDRDGNLWTGDGTTGQGRVWKIGPLGGVEEAFRVQPIANDANLVLGVGGVGRDVRSLPPGAITVTATSRGAQNTAGSQPLVANGVAFDRAGDLYIADTARGAIWKAEFDRHGTLTSPTGCDTTFASNTLCLDNVLVAHPYLEGADGIALDVAGNIWVDANERNAVVVVTKDGRVLEVFRNPVNSVGLRNAADTTQGNTRILEFPTSPFLLGKKFCTANSDGDRRDNSPRAAGEINGGAGNARGKISCMDQELTIPGPRPGH